MIEAQYSLLFQSVSYLLNQTRSSDYAIAGDGSLPVLSLSAGRLQVEAGVVIDKLSVPGSSPLRSSLKALRPSTQPPRWPQHETQGDYICTAALRRVYSSYGEVSPPSSPCDSRNTPTMSALNPSTASQEPNPPASAAPAISESKVAEDDGLLSKGKRLLGLGKKKQGDADTQQSETGAPDGTLSPTSAPSLMPSPPLSTAPADRRASPRGSPRMLPVGASPNRRMHRSSSPGLHSPSASSIFERNVQEPEPSVDVPAHIKTEDHIPPALDASSLAITDDHLNPDEVEIVMSSAHQPASSAVAGGLSDSVYSPPLVHEDSAASSHADVTEAAPDYGSLDMTDPRRLSFISFADVVQAEHVEHDRQELLGSGEALQFMSLSSTANRSQSPVRSPVSSHGLSASPPTSGTTSPKTADFGRTRSPGSPTFPTVHGTQSPSLGGELPLQIETLRQTLRKTHSGDLSGARSQPLSAVSLDDNTADKPPFK